MAPVLRSKSFWLTLGYLARQQEQRQTEAVLLPSSCSCDDGKMVKTRKEKQQTLEATLGRTYSIVCLAN